MNNSTTSEKELAFLHGRWTSACDSRVDKHLIAYCTLQYCNRGEVELWYDQRRYLVTSGMFWAAFPGPRIKFHAACGQASWDHRYIAFTGALAGKWESLSLIPLKPVLPKAKVNWAAEMDLIIAEGMSGREYDRLRAINRLENILYYLAETELHGERRNQWLQKVISLLDTGGSFPDYAELADSLNVSERTLRRRFQKLTGITIHEHTIQQRLQRACGMLRNTDYPIAEIAQKLGYRDIYYFSRQFTHRMRTTPTDFRKNRQ